jgi:hypothetical protein
MLRLTHAQITLLLRLDNGTSAVCANVRKSTLWTLIREGLIFFDGQVYMVSAAGDDWLAEYESGNIKPLVRLSEAQKNVLSELLKRDRQFAFKFDKRTLKSLREKGLILKHGSMVYLSMDGKSAIEQLLRKASSTNASVEVVHND